MRYTIFSLFLCLIIISCSPVYKTVTIGDYEQQEITDATLVIAPIKNLMVNYMGNVKDEFGEGDQQTLIINHFKETLLKNLKNRSTFSSVTYDNYREEPKVKQTKFDMDDAFGLYIALPTDTTTIEFETTKPDFILFIEDLTIGTDMFDEGPNFGLNEPGNEESVGCSVYSMQNGRSRIFHSQKPTNLLQPPFAQPPTHMMHHYNTPKTKYLIYKCGFVFWDNQKHSVAVYGKILARSKSEGHGLGVVQIIRIEHWQDIDEQFIGFLLSGTPFSR